MRKFLIMVAVALLLVLWLIPVSPVGAANPTVTVSATGYYLSISSAPTTWTLNSLTGDSIVNVDTVYYANPLGDTTAPAEPWVRDSECYFTITNSSNVDIDITANMSDFTGAYTMENHDDGANAAGNYGAYVWYSGMVYASKVIMKSSASSAFLTSLSSSNSSAKWGAEVETQTDAFAAASAVTATITLTYAAS